MTSTSRKPTGLGKFVAWCWPTARMWRRITSCSRSATRRILVGTTPADYPGGPLAGIAFQRNWEERAFAAGGSNYKAPAQRVGDFLARKPSASLGDVVPSYKPGVTPTDLAACLPD